MLSLEDFEIDSSNLNDNSDKETEVSTDLRDIEFQLMHNMNEIHVSHFLLLLYHQMKVNKLVNIHHHLFQLFL